MELDSIDMIKAYVGAGLGISVGPKMAMEPDDEEHLGMIDLMHLFPVEQAGVVTLRGKDLSPPTSEFHTNTGKQFQPVEDAPGRSFLAAASRR